MKPISPEYINAFANRLRHLSRWPGQKQSTMNLSAWMPLAGLFATWRIPSAGRHAFRFGSEKADADERNSGERLAIQFRLWLFAILAKSRRHMPCSGILVMAKRKKLPPLTPRAP